MDERDRQLLQAIDRTLIATADVVAEQRAALAVVMDRDRNDDVVAPTTLRLVDAAR